MRAGKPFYGLEFVTRSLPCFIEIYNIFYVNGVKVIPKNIYELLTPIAFAHFIRQGDVDLKVRGGVFIFVQIRILFRTSTFNECANYTL